MASESEIEPEQPQAKEMTKYERVNKDIEDFAAANGLNPDALKDAARNDERWTDPGWKLGDGTTVQDRYNKYIPFMGGQKWEAPTLRGAQQCYCLVCKRKVTPVGARIVGNRCCGTCPFCQRKVCTFVAKTQTRQQPAKKRAPAKKTGKKKKKKST